MIGMCMQEDRLWIADPKAVNHILQKSGYLYGKPKNTQERASLLSGRGVVWAQGGLSVVVGHFLLSACQRSHRRSAQAPQEGYGPGIWSRRG